MKMYNYIYKNSESLNTYISQNITEPYLSVLIQVFTGVLDKKEVQKVLDLLTLNLPTSKIIGASTSGEIISGEMNNDSIVISFTLFDKTELETFYSPSVEFQSGVKMAKQILKNDTKAVICLGEALKSDPQNFFVGFETINNKVIVAGGNAGDNDKFQATFIIKDNIIYDEGMVLCTLNSKELKVHNQYTLNWTPLGSELTITKANGNIVQEINNKPILEVYKYYFGDEIEKGLPASIVNFPLVKKENGVDIARSLIVLLEDKSFLYAGHFKVGDKVRFAIGNVEEVLQNAQKFSHEVSLKPSEGMFIYSCSVRKNFLKEQLKHEFELLSKVAPSAGFFTYGEFYNTGESNQVLNITTTILSLSESEQVNKVDDTQSEGFINTSLKSLTHLINVTQSELENKIQLLNKTQTQLIESEKMASLGALVSGIAHEINTPVGVGLSGVSQIQHEVSMIEKLFLDDTLSEEELTQHIEIMKKLSKTIGDSLENAANLIKSFKQISIDQHSGELRVFNLKEYLDEVVISLNNELKKKDIQVVNKIDKEICMSSYPGIYSQIFSNLILNSLHHAFDTSKNNIITISANADNGIEIDYRDNGKGVPSENQSKIFDPFFTTSRGKGGSGLGLNIVYNLVNQKLGGSIQYISDEIEGFHIKIKIKNYLD